MDKFSPTAFLTKMFNQKRIYILSIIIVLLVGHGCSFFFQNSGPVPITVSTSTFFIVWNSEEESLSDLPSSTDYFKLYYRELFAKDWILLKSTRGKQSRVMVSVFELEGHGNYEFGIEQVYRNGRSSEIHGSTDFSAKPAGGWYLNVSD